MDVHPLKKAKEIVDEIHKVTQKLVLTGERGQEDSESENYANLMDLREPLVEELNLLKNKIDKTMTKTTEFSEIRKTLEDIRALDTGHLRYVEHIRSNVQNSYKDVKQGQKLHSGYQFTDGESGTHMFDKKQ